MSSPKAAQQNESGTDATKSRITTLLDTAVADALKEQQFDSFYQKTAEALRAADERCVPVLTRRILRAGYKEKEILLQILKYFKGVEHIVFLQDILSREVITARMGRIILDIFNKSDIILESGISSRLLDLDALSQKINHSVQSGSIDASLIEVFISRPSREQEGIMVELIEEAGPTFAIFLARLFDINTAVGHAMLRLAASEPAPQSYALLAQLYEKTGNKEILKTAKKMAHTLKQQGIDVAAAESKKPHEAVFKAADLPEPRAFATMIDAEGFRLIFMLKPISQHEIKIFNIMLSQDKGIADIEAVISLRRETQKLIKNLFADKKIEFTEIPTGTAAYLVKEAAGLTEQLTGAVSPTMVQWKTLFGDILPDGSMPPVYQIYSAAAIQADTELLQQSEKLLEQTEIPFWFIVTDSARSMWLRCRQAAENTASDAAMHVEASDNELIKETADQFFTDERLNKFRRRLEELAYIFHIKGNTELAKIALAQALDLPSHGRIPSENTFCSAVIRSGIAYFKSYAAKKTAGSPS
jgi:hypothetical protein